MWWKFILKSLMYKLHYVWYVVLSCHTNVCMHIYLILFYSFKKGVRQPRVHCGFLQVCLLELALCHS